MVSTRRGAAAEEGRQEDPSPPLPSTKAAPKRTIVTADAPGPSSMTFRPVRMADVKREEDTVVLETAETTTVEVVDFTADDTPIEKKRPKIPDIEDLWKRDLDAIGEMRANEDAPVDSIGCHMLHDKDAEPKVQRFQILLALMLSSQTKDEVTAAAMQRLRSHGCTVDAMLTIPQAYLEKILCPVGFYRRKAMYIKAAAAVLHEKYADDVPSTLEGLVALQGVGPKMGHLVMQTAWNETVGIAVDTHVHRIVNRLRWVSTSTPEATMKKLEAILPRSRWRDVNKLLVGFGQTICTPVKPKCSACLLRESCPSSSAKTTKKGKGSQASDEVEESK